MNSGAAFQIARIDRVESGLIAVGGRAYRDLRIGDTLEDRAPRPNESGQSAEFTIVGISTYGRTIQLLGRMLTGVLLLRGDDDRDPRVETLFIKKRGTQDKAVARSGRRMNGQSR